MDEWRKRIQGRSCHVLSPGRPSLFCYPICNGPSVHYHQLAFASRFAHVKKLPDGREVSPRYVPSRIWFGIFHGPRLNVMGWGSVHDESDLSHVIFLHVSSLHHDSINFFFSCLTYARFMHYCMTNCTRISQNEMEERLWRSFCKRKESSV